MVPISHTRNFFNELPPEFRAALDGIGTEHSTPAGQTLLQAGAQCSQLYEVRAGTLECRMADGRGGESVAATITAGEWLGLAEAFSGLPAAVDVIAATPVLLRIIDCREFEVIVGRHPLLAGRLLRLFSLSVSAIYQQARDRNALPLKERLLRTLYMLAFSHGKTLRQHQGILIEMPQEELSRRLAAARQTLNRQLKALEQEGLIRVNYGSITVLGLHRLAERQLNPARKPSKVLPDVS